MKNILVLIALLGFVACSSAKKDDAKEMVAQAETAASDSSDEAKAAYEKAQKEAEEAAQKAAAEAQDAGQAAADSADSSFTGNFGPYEGTEKSKTTCTNGDDVRTIAVLDGANGGCGVVYNKNGEDRTIAKADYQMDFCPSVQEKVKGNLEAAGFTCQ